MQDGYAGTVTLTGNETGWASVVINCDGVLDLGDFKLDAPHLL